MRFKLGCATAVLLCLCFDTSWGGALKNMFTKNKTQEATQKPDEQDQERPQIADKASSEQSSADTPTVAPEAQDKDKKKEKKEIKGNPVIYRIGKKEIRRDEVLADIKNLPQQVVEQTDADQLFTIMKRQKLMTYLIIEQAKKAGMDKQKDFIEQMEKLKERMLFENYLLKELEPKASHEPTLQQHYNKYLVEFKSGPEVKISNIAVNTEKEAKDVIDALNKGAPFDKLQKDKGLPSSENLTQYVPVASIQGDLKAKFKKIEKNAFTTDPIKIGETYHVIKIMDMRDSKPASFDEMKPVLFRIVLKNEIDKLINKLEVQYNVQKFNEDGTPEVSTPETSKKVPAINAPATPPVAPKA